MLAKKQGYFGTVDIDGLARAGSEVLIIAMKTQPRFYC
jgi:histidinol dehydrogenase